MERFFTTLWRWKCVLCAKTFTYYPPFCVPYKRFVLAAITERCARYVEPDETSYRAVVRSQGMALGYAEDAAASKQLSASTVWRWLSDLGAGTKRLQAGLRLIQAKDPSSVWHRQIRPMAPRKYRSAHRREALQTGRLLLVVAPVFERLGLPYVTPHAARHAYVSTLQAQSGFLGFNRDRCACRASRIPSDQNIAPSVLPRVDVRPDASYV